jgi:hypothetical protein
MWSEECKTRASDERSEIHQKEKKREREREILTGTVAGTGGYITRKQKSANHRLLRSALIFLSTEQLDTNQQKSARWRAAKLEKKNMGEPS